MVPSLPDTQCAPCCIVLPADDSTALVAAQTVGAAVLGAGAIAAFVGSSLLGSLQKV